MEMLKQGTKFRQALKRQQPVKKTIEQIKLEQLQLREAELEARLEDLSAVPPVEIVLNVVVSEGDREERDAPAEIEFKLAHARQGGDLTFWRVAHRATGDVALARSKAILELREEHFFAAGAAGAAVLGELEAWHQAAHPER